MESSFSQLKTEHQEITCCLQNVRQLFAQGQVLAGLEMLKRLEAKVQVHYQHEDELLFSKVFEHPKLSQGGPFCTMYFDSFMRFRPLRQLEFLMQKVEPQFQEPKPEGSAENYKVKGSPLAIPSEEHLAILSLIRALIRLLSQSPELNSGWRDEALNQLMTWIRANHEKEENCLFTHIRNLLLVS